MGALKVQLLGLQTLRGGCARSPLIHGYLKNLHKIHEKQLSGPSIQGLLQGQCTEVWNRRLGSEKKMYTPLRSNFQNDLINLPMRMNRPRAPGPGPLKKN